MSNKRHLTVPPKPRAMCIRAAVQLLLTHAGHVTVLICGSVKPWDTRMTIMWQTRWQSPNPQSTACEVCHMRTCESAISHTGRSITMADRLRRLVQQHLEGTATHTCGQQQCAEDIPGVPPQVASTDRNEIRYTAEGEVGTFEPPPSLTRRSRAAESSEYLI